ncbi:hypothetical protein [Streptomyces sp. NPDC005266]|uniref:hypothetical protein n=1 Tax=Streptomyces sp. NPDC005266 TaxID=3154877 RepID=UPI0033AE6ABE
MAEDHRYSWLDDSAAERLLRGEQVEGRLAGPDGRSDEPCVEAERLAAVLGAVAAASRPTAEAAPGAAPLPGEETAVAAFRVARAERATAGRPAPEGPSGLLGRLRGDRPGLRRPLRAGMVAALAGCALSGFAVAAAAGVLPTFGAGGGTPGPAVSVSVSDAGPSGGQSAHPDISEDGSSQTSGPGGSRDNDASDAASAGAQGGAATSGGQDDGDHQGHGNGKDGKGKGHSSTGSSNNGRGSGQWALDVCRQYLASESGTGPDVSKKALHKLKKAAGGRTAIHGYCVQLLAEDGKGTPHSGNDNGSDSGSGSGGGSDSSGGSGDNSGGSGDNSGSDDGGSGGDPQSDDGGSHPDQGPPPPPPPPPSSADPSGDTPAPTGSVTATATETGAG